MAGIIEVPVTDASTATQPIRYYNEGTSGSPSVSPVARILGPDGNPITTGNRLPVELPGSVLTQAPATGEITLPANESPIAIKAAAEPLEGRLQVILYPPAAGTIYWGDSGVTPATGAPLAAGDPPVIFPFSGATPIAVYACSDGTERACRVVEAK